MHLTHVPHRLNVLSTVVRKPMEQIFCEFKGAVAEWRWKKAVMLRVQVLAAWTSLKALAMSSTIWACLTRGLHMPGKWWMLRAIDASNSDPLCR